MFVLLVFVLLVSCRPKNFNTDYFKVESVVSGNQVKLVNDYVVNLIGVSDTKESYAFLQEKLANSDIGFVFDSYSPDYRNSKDSRMKEFYAYIILKDGTCLNSVILLNRLSPVNYQPYLHDSIIEYVNYRGGEGNNDELANKSKDDGSEPSNNNTSNTDSIYEVRISGEMKLLKDACDYMNPVTRNYAVNLAGHNSGNFSLDQIINIYDAIRPPNWHYVNDPKGHEYFSSASNTLANTNLSGDCDDFAILMYSLITSIGGEARITLCWNQYMGHAFTEVNINSISPDSVIEAMMRRYSEYNISELNYRKDNTGVWLNLDWWAAYPGGKYMDRDAEIIFYPNNDKYVATGI